MEKEIHKNEVNTQIHPTLAVHLSGSFNDQLNTNSPFNSGESARPNRYSCWKKLSKNKVQISSVIGGYIQLLCTGLHIAWGVWRVDFREPWFRGPNGTFIFMILSFYVAAIVGGIMAGCIVNVWRKQAIYCLSGSIYAVSSLILIIWCSEQMGVLFGRILAGFGYGLLYNVIVIHAGENTMKQMRGMVTSTINLFLWSSIFIGSLLIATVQIYISTTVSSDRMIGIFSLTCAILSLMYTMFWTEESLVYLLNRGKLGEALELLAKLRSEPENSSNISDDFEEMRLMVIRDKSEDQNIFKNRNAKPLAMMVALKLVHVLTNNFLINWTFLLITMNVLPLSNRRLTPVIFTAVRLAGSILQTFLADSFGRKTFLNVSCLLSVITLLLLEILLIIVTQSTTTNWVQAALCIALQLFAAFGIDPMPHVILSEAFATSKKNWSTVFVSTCENATQMLFIGISFADGAITNTSYHWVLVVSVTLIVVLAVILSLLLPETRGLSLSASRDAFRNVTFKCFTTTR